MAQAIGDPEELDRFAHSLTQFITTVNEATNALNCSFSALGDSWCDEKKAVFEQEYSTLLQQLAIFEVAASEQVPYLHLLASRLRDYLQS